MTSREACAILNKTPYSRCVNGIAPTDTLYVYIWEADPNRGWPTFYGLLTVDETRLRLITVYSDLPVGRQTRVEVYPLDDVERLADRLTLMTI